MKFGNKAIQNIFNSAEELKNVLNIGESSPIFPFEVISGFVTETRTGARRDYSASDQSEETYRVFTGEETPLVRWADSTRAYLADEDDKVLKSEYKPGRVIYGNILSQDFAQSFETDTLGKDLKDWITGESFVIKSDSWNVSQNDLYNLYIVSEKGNNKLLKIDTATNHFNEMTGEWVYSEILLLAINLELEQAGSAVQQKIQFSAPGEAYAFPKVTQQTNDEGETISDIGLDTSKLSNLPVDSVQVSLWGTAPISSVTVIGRPTYDVVKDGDNELYNGEISQPRHLLNNKFLSPIDDALKTTGSMVNNFVMMLDAQLQLKTYFKEWKDQQESKYDDQIKKTYDGMLTANDTETVESNPVANTGQFTNNIWNDYTVKTGNKELNTSLSGYFSVEKIILEAEMKVADIMNLSSFINAQVEKLPMDITESIPFRAVSLPIVGGFLNKFVSGFGLGWASQKNWYNSSSFVALFPAGQYDYITKAVYAVNNGKALIPIDIFNSDDDTQASAIVGSNAVRTTIRYELTDRYTVNEGATILNTSVIGQKVNGTKQVLTEKLKAEPKAVTGYIPDMIIVDTPAKMNYTVTYFTGDTEVYRAVFQTKGKYFNNYREWKSINFHSHWFEDTGKVVKGIETVYTKNPPDALPNELSHRITSPFGTAVVNVSGTVTKEVKYVANYSQFGISKDDLINKYAIIFKDVVKSTNYPQEEKTSRIEKITGARQNTGLDVLRTVDAWNQQILAWKTTGTVQYTIDFDLTDTDIEIIIKADAKNITNSIKITMSEIDLIYKDTNDENK